MSRLQFTIDKKSIDTRARAARFKTLHNEVLTPLFMPVGTYAAVRHIRTPDLLSTGSQILLANTYHLLLRPGPEVFKSFGDIHRFMNWPKSVLTDSGGYQIFSLPKSRRITEEGAKFQSYLDGTSYLLSPELSIGTQRAIGSDIMMALDVCVPSTCDYSVALEAMDRTHRWAERSLQARGESLQSLFGIVQGACFEDLRKQSASAITSLPFDGFAIGGLAVGETKSEREDFTELCAQLLPENSPRYLMGVGTPIDLLEAVARGVDMFDCIIPTALAEQGIAYTFEGIKKVGRSVYKFSKAPIEEGCPCEACTTYSLGYLHHTSKRKEPYGTSLIALHNITFYHRLMAKMRQGILDDSFSSFYREAREKLAREDQQHPAHPPKIKRRRERRLEWGNFALKINAEGGAHIQHKESLEIMHRSASPDVEAHKLYVEESGLAEALKNSKPLTVWDLGLGCAHNAMATLNEWEKLKKAGQEGETLAQVHLYSFENDLDALRLAVARPDLFKHIRHGAPVALLERGEWCSEDGLFKWKLIEGDFRKEISQAPPADFIFFDPFSSKTNPESWTYDFLKKIFDQCRGNESRLITYSQSTAFRAALLAAGFYVSSTQGFGPQGDSTHAANEARLAPKLLDKTWLERFTRSERPYPVDVPKEESEIFRQKILNHPQFL